MGTAGQRGRVRFVLELTPTEHGRVEGVLALQGSDEPQRFSGWLDLLRLLEKAAQVTEVWQPSLAQGHTGGNDGTADGGQGHGFVGLNEPRGPPHHRLAGGRALPRPDFRQPSQVGGPHTYRSTMWACGCRPAPELRAAMNWGQMVKAINGQI